MAGGYSRRMKIDKGSIVYHEKAQREHIADVLALFCADVFISCRKEQALVSNYPLLLDQYENIGPMSALLSAFEQNPTNAWLIMACDMPLMNKENIAFLIENRNTNKIATTFQHPISKQIEPFATIWEPSSYPILKRYFEAGNRSPARFLKKNDIQTVFSKDTAALFNINNPKERIRIKELLK